MRAYVLSGRNGVAWGAGPRSAVELKKAAAHYDRTAALNSPAPTVKAENARLAGLCRSMADVM